jgi:hypothetical protein
VLLAPPSALPLLTPSGAYGDAVRITPSSTTAPRAPILIARLQALLPTASSCECAAQAAADQASSSSSSSSGAAVVVLPRGLLVALPPPSSSSTTAGAIELQPLVMPPSAFQACIEPLSAR